MKCLYLFKAAIVVAFFIIVSADSINAQQIIDLDKPKIDNVDKIERISIKNENKVISIQGLPDDFPKYIETGNLEKDIENYNLKKDQWIIANPDKYKTLVKSNVMTEPEKKERNLKDNQNQ